MKCGLYKLVFAPGVEYIGKSVDIEKRLEEHRINMLRNKASERMMAAFHKYGMPTAQILLECHEDHISMLEAYFINKYAPSLNTVYPKTMSDEQFQVLVRNPELLNLSTVELMDMIERFASQAIEYDNTIADLETTIEDLEMDRTAEEINSAVYARLQREKDNIIEYYENRLAGYKAELEAKKPWWKFW